MNQILKLTNQKNFTAIEIVTIYLKIYQKEGEEKH